jgi:butyryl-CoA dehydrogenase
MWYMNEERELMLNVAKDFVEQEVKPVAMEVDRTSEFPTKLFKRELQLPRSAAGSERIIQHSRLFSKR